MSRLFVTDRELRLIADINREVIRDVIGQSIRYFPISVLKTKVHDVYNEAVKKVFDNPIEVPALVEAAFNEASEIDEFGPDSKFKLDVYVQWRDMVESGIDITLGDYFSYGDVFYEIVDVVFIKTIYGQVEHKDGIKVSGVKARKGAIDAPLYGPTDISYSDEDAVQHAFKQSRGKEETDTGEQESGDVRELVHDGVLEKPLTGGRKICNQGDGKTDLRVRGEVGGKVSSFYGDDEDE